VKKASEVPISVAEMVAGKWHEQLHATACSFEDNIYSLQQRFRNCRLPAQTPKAVTNGVITDELHATLHLKSKLLCLDQGESLRNELTPKSTPQGPLLPDAEATWYSRVMFVSVFYLAIAIIQQLFTRVFELLLQYC